MKRIIGKVTATEKQPTTIDEFYFWTSKEMILNPFDVIKVKHINDSTTYGVIEEISHITDTQSYLTSFISNDFGDVETQTNTLRIGMNYVKAKVINNTKNIYIPVRNGEQVCFANAEEIQKALGLDKENIKNPLVCGYLEMYEGVGEEIKVSLPVYFNSHFLLGPEGAHLNISGISGLASKTSYAMFLLKSIQQYYTNEVEKEIKDDVAFVLLNVKGRDLLAIDETNEDLPEKDKDIYKMLGLESSPFSNVKYFYPYSDKNISNTYAQKTDVQTQLNLEKAFKYKYIFEYDKENLDLLFSNIEDPNQTMESIINYIISKQGNFGNIRNWNNFIKEVDAHCKPGFSSDKTITVSSWRKFNRIIRKTLNNPIFAQRASEQDREIRLQDAIKNIQKNEVFVIDIAKLDENMQSFVFGDVIRDVSDLQLGQFLDISEEQIPSKIIVFIDELNKYSSKDAPKSSPILKQIIDISERGRSLGIILFSAEQFKSAIHDRVKGNCSTHAYGRSNAIEISKNDYRYLPKVYKNMMTRLKQGEYIIQNPVFRSLLNIKFPKPLYKQFK